MPTIKNDPVAQLAYLEKKDAALRRKTSGPRPNPKTHRAAAKDYDNAELAAKIVSRRLNTARKNAQARGITPPAAAAKKTAAAKAES
ncbi:MAG: hypothetical protein ACOCUN_03650 [Jiangellaceae bacterium]